MNRQTQIKKKKNKKMKDENNKVAIKVIELEQSDFSANDDINQDMGDTSFFDDIQVLLSFFFGVFCYNHTQTHLTKQSQKCWPIENKNTHTKKIK